MAPEGQPGRPPPRTGRRLLVRREPGGPAGLPPPRSARAPPRHLPDRTHPPHGVRGGGRHRLRRRALRRRRGESLGDRWPGPPGERCCGGPLRPHLGTGPQGGWARTRGRSRVRLRAGAQQCQRPPRPARRHDAGLRLRRGGLRDRGGADGRPAGGALDRGDSGRPRQPAQPRHRCRGTAGRPPAGAGRPRPGPGLLGGGALGVRRRRRAATRPHHPGRPGRDRGQGGRPAGRRTRALGDRGRGRRPPRGRRGRGQAGDGQRPHAARGRGEGGPAGRRPPTPRGGGRRAAPRPGERAGRRRRPAPRRGGRPPRAGGDARRPRAARDARGPAVGDRAGPQRGARAARRHPPAVPGERWPAGGPRRAR